MIYGLDVEPISQNKHIRISIEETEQVLKKIAEIICETNRKHFPVNLTAVSYKIWMAFFEEEPRNDLFFSQRYSIF